MKNYSDLTLKAKSKFFGTMQTIYIGSPIDQAVGMFECFKELADAVLAGDNKVTIFNPLTAYVNAHKAESSHQLFYVKKINEYVISQSDAAAFAWRNQPTFGVPLEIDYFARAGKPFFICNLSGKGLGLYVKALVAENYGFISESLEEMSVQIKAFNELMDNGDLLDHAENLVYIKAAVARKVKQLTNGFETEEVSK